MNRGIVGDWMQEALNEPFKYDVFICHSSKDKPIISTLIEDFKKENVTYWVDAEQINFGDSITEKITEGLETSNYVIPCISKNLKNIDRPSNDKDILYKSNNQAEILPHPDDSKRINDQPHIFIGPIASANILLKDAKHKDELREKFGVKAIEMEASGIADSTWIHEVGYLVVRGICDYCDLIKIMIGSNTLLL